MLEYCLNFVVAQTPAIGAGDSTVADGDWLNGLLNLGIFVLAIIVPFVLGKLLSSQLKMPTHAMAFSWILLAIIVTAVVISTGKLRYGPDINGGTNLIYQIMQDPGSKGRKVSAKDFVSPLSIRLDPSGMNETIVRPRGEDQIEIVIAAVGGEEVDDIKQKIVNAGILQFRIVASKNDHSEIIEAAKAQASDPDANIRLRREVSVVNKTTNASEIAGIWRKLGKNEASGEGDSILGYQAGDTIRDRQTGKILEPVLTGRPHDLERWLESVNVKDVEILLALNRKGTPYIEVNGGDLARAKSIFGKSGNYEVEFTMTTGGGEKMLRLTSANQPDTSGFKRRMAILLDDVVLSAPSLNSPIRSDGVIQGNFTQKQVDFLVNILNSGSLPGAISHDPISQNVVGATMGADAIAKGKLASGLSLIVTVLCVWLYYRFSGFIATLALVLNLAMILACMILFKQPLTLPGLAGLVLSVGMSVDANVLVFERIREERERKATPRMAIRNGFDRAWTTIFDSNLTTLISAAVLYYVGTEQIKGFAITLIIGLAISMFTAVFFAHKLFEIAERKGMAWLGMSDYVNSIKRSFFGPGDIDFLKSRYICYAGSGLLILIGIVGTALRGREILDIDFNGGTSVVFAISESTEPDKVRRIAEEAFKEDKAGLPIQTTLTNVEMTDFSKNSVYKMDVSIKDDADVRERLLKAFNGSTAPALVTYDLKAVVTGTDTATPPVEPAAESAEAKPAAESTIQLKLTDTKGQAGAKLNAKQIIEQLVGGAKAVERTLYDGQVELVPIGAKDWLRSSEVGYPEWTIRLPFDKSATESIVEKMKESVRSKPVFQSFSKIEGRVAGEMQQKAMLGLLLSLIFITIYIWFRFNRVAYGIAAVIALVHDVLITIAFIAISHWLFKPLGFLLIEDFKISLTIVAAILTIIGYSLNDTIVVFDRIREVKGKSPNLTEQMINASVTQTLSRTLLTSSTTIVAILLMYILGGEGIHGFAFCLLIGILVGTYSSIFVAAPILLWLAKREQAAKLASRVS